ncbi:TPA: hypothetical protein QCK11_004338 [Enterobacter asburiae]|nr:hypothetical protein [Enterobacter asburiae]
MNMNNLKGILSGVLLIFSLTSAIVFFYKMGSASLLDLLRGEDYVYYDPKQIPVLLLLPVMVLIDLFFIFMIFLIFPCVEQKHKKKMEKVIQKSLIPVTLYTTGALIIGFLLSMAISIYPLGTKYYQCSSTSIVSSGSHYARTKEMCKQRAYSDKTEQIKSPAILDMISGTDSESNKY